MSRSSSTRVASTKCAQIAALVEEARQAYPEIVERTSEDPQFRGSVEEADLLFGYIDSLRPELAADFVDWRTSRLAVGELPCSPAGTVLHTRHRLVVAHDGSVTIE